MLLALRRLVWDGQKANYTYAQPDALIAATASVHGLGVVTRDTGDFSRAGVHLLDPWTSNVDAGRAPISAPEEATARTWVMKEFD